MSETTQEYALLVYGATMPGIAAARNAASMLDADTKILFINPQPGWGGIAGVGRLPAWDRRDWQKNGLAMTPHGGSFRRWYESEGQAYNPVSMEQTLKAEIAESDQIYVLDFWDIESIHTDNTGRITTVDVTPLKRKQGDTTTTGDSVSITATTFVDASESGRLTRLANIPYTTGRQDWGPDDRQMAATLLFQLDNVNWAEIKQSRSANGRETYRHRTDPRSGRRLFWGGHYEADNADAVAEFEDAHPRFRIKAMNATEVTEERFWFNAVLIYDVDGRFDARERGRILTEDGDHRPWDTDRARQRGLEALQDDRFIAAMQDFPGLSDAELVFHDDEPAIAETLYLRETIHTYYDDTQFALERHHLQDAGQDPQDGADAEHYDERIGLGFYWMNNNGYRRDQSSNDAEFLAPDNPAYIPYETLTSHRCPNLLIPGYAASISSQAWFEMRVLPNLCVLGDAAGVAAAMSLLEEQDPRDFAIEQIERIQTILREEFDAVLDKETGYGVVE
ncbi:FAD-dependent oxidoreductase [Halorussus salinus]|uniref:FAD-dependent oxidoreductase n=1 Tax=Halorussus salinus TaxID=1364935 RepID=UPI00138F6074|nr:FAD-dependent oxidoreductase [Halorussus salinus]